ncbi:hypothetical protein HK26_02880 [Acetobacter okinawensis]|uniref:Uncharacterized protein n=1 Tax=Acetobacter okinawensis TaxID=1076594 RepID=A0A252BTW6_9PROT|nr:hypothetical protein HK26_02880 [Acetobacter okinawensis]
MYDLNIKKEKAPSPYSISPTRTITRRTSPCPPGPVQPQTPRPVRQKKGAGVPVPASPLCRLCWL